MKNKIFRTALSVALVVGAVLAVRWTIRSMVTRTYHADRAVGGGEEIPFVPARRVWSLAAITPNDLHVNLAGLAIRRRAERLHMPYSLASSVAEEKAASASWERLDDENALTLKNLSGMERVYKTPEGSIVLREVRPIKGDDSLMEDFTIPAEMIPVHGDTLTPDVLARRSARRVKELMPPVVRDVVIGSPLMTELIERGGGAAFIVHCVAEMSEKAAVSAVESAARKAGWTRTQLSDLPENLPSPADALRGKKGAASADVPKTSWSKDNLTFYYETVPRPYLAGCDVNYRFTDDEVYIPTKGKANEN